MSNLPFSGFTPLARMAGEVRNGLKANQGAMSKLLAVALVATALALPLALTIDSQTAIGAGADPCTLYAHSETTTIGGSSYRLLKIDTEADGTAEEISIDASTVGRFLMFKTVVDQQGGTYSAGTWTVYYRGRCSATWGTLEGRFSVDIGVRHSDDTFTSIATNVAQTPTILSNGYATYSGTYTIAEQSLGDTDRLEVDFYWETTSTGIFTQEAFIMIDDPSLAVADQTRIENVAVSFEVPPTPPTLYLPADGAITEDNAPTFEWTVGGALTTTACL